MFATLINCYFLLLQAEPATPTPVSSPAGDYTFLWFAAGLVVGVIIGVLVALVVVKAIAGSGKQPSPFAGVSLPQPNVQAPGKQEAAPDGLRCPACNSTYTDASLKYCLSDGAALVRADGQQDPSATLVYPEKGRKDLPPTIPSGLR